MPQMPQLFISHASEDKTAFVRPLAHALRAKGLKVWYDEFSLKPGDSLRSSIDRGLLECSTGIVVLSESFFAKAWPQRELDALFTAEISGRSKIIPIWHEIDAAGIASRSPLLADRVAINSTDGVKAVALKIAEQFDIPSKYSGDEIADILTNLQASGLFAGEAAGASCESRFLNLNAFKEEYQEVVDNAFSDFSDEQLENIPPKVNEQLKIEKERLSQKYRIPNDVYLTTDEPIHEENLAYFRETIGLWASGTLDPEASAELICNLDLQEMDEFFILMNIPNFAISSRQRPLLEKAIIELGCGWEDGYQKVDKLCAELRMLD